MAFRAFRIFACTLAIIFAVPALATVSTTSNTVTDQGNGVTTAFAYSFPIPSASYAVVQLVNTTVTPNTSVTLSQGQYSISGIGTATGGTVTYPVVGSPIASGYNIVITRIVPLVQTTSLCNQGPTFCAIERALDYLTYIAQQLNSQIAAINSPTPTPTPPSTLSVRRILTGNADSATAADSTIAWNSSTASAKAESFPTCGAGYSGLLIKVKDEIGTAQSYPITITPAAGTIDNSVSYIMRGNLTSVSLQCDGVSNWLVL